MGSEPVDNMISFLHTITLFRRLTGTSTVRERAERPRSFRREALEHGVQPRGAQRGEEVLDVRPWKAVHGFEAERGVLGDTGAVELEEAESVEGFARVLRRAHRLSCALAFVDGYFLGGTLQLGD